MKLAKKTSADPVVLARVRAQARWVRVANVMVVRSGLAQVIMR